VEGVETLVVVTRVVMERDQSSRAGHANELGEIRHRSVTPTDTLGVLVVLVLGIVDQDVRSFGEGVTRRPLGISWEAIVAEGGLVVWHECENRAVLAESVTQS